MQVLAVETSKVKIDIASEIMKDLLMFKSPSHNLSFEARFFVQHKVELTHRLQPIRYLSLSV